MHDALSTLYAILCGIQIETQEATGHFLRSRSAISVALLIHYMVIEYETQKSLSLIFAFSGAETLKC